MGPHAVPDTAKTEAKEPILARSHTRVRTDTGLTLHSFLESFLALREVQTLGPAKKKLP